MLNRKGLRSYLFVFLINRVCSKKGGLWDSYKEMIALAWILDDLNLNQQSQEM